jgi:hypothetical protein
MDKERKEFKAIWVSPETHQKVKIECAKGKVTMDSLIRNFIEKKCLNKQNITSTQQD